MILQIIDYAGVAVFAVSGALAAGRKNLDLFGVIVIALATAVGGGTVRDLLLDRHPVFWIAEPGYVVTILVAALLTIPYARFRTPPNSLLQIADALGLAFFSISGAQVAETRGHAGLIIVMMATITGAFGGVIRDVLCNEIPMVLRRGQIYATAVIAGSALYVLLGACAVARPLATVLGMLTIAGLRGAAILWNWSLPVFILDDERE